MSFDIHPSDTHIFGSNTANPVVVLKASAGKSLYIEGSTIGTGSLTEGKILIGNSSNVAEQQSITGDVTLSPDGVVTLNAVNNASGTTTLSSITTNSKGLVLSNSTPTLPAGQVYVGNASNQPAAVALSGDATLNSAGNLTLSSVTSALSNIDLARVSVNAKGLVTSLSSTPLAQDNIWVGNSSNVATAVPKSTLAGNLPLQDIGIFVPPQWGLSWKPKLASAGASQATIAVVGDSISEGYCASNFQTTSYVALLKSTLQTAYGDGGSGYRGSQNSLYYDSYGAAQTGLSTTGTWTAAKSSGGPSNCAIYTNTNGATATFANVQGTTVTFYYGKGSTAGTCEVRIDGVLVDTINANNATNDVGVGTYTGQIAGNKSVQITNTSADFTLVFGVSGTNASGVVVNNYSVAGQTSGGFLNISGSPYGSQIDWSGGSSYPCDLLIYALAVNDANGQPLAAASAEAYLTNVLSVVNRVRDYVAYTGTGNTDILFFMPHIGRWQSTGPQYYAMMGKLESVLRSMNVAYVNMSTMYHNSYTDAYNNNVWSAGTTNVTGATGSDPIHPGNTGHSLYADALLRVVNSTTIV